MLIVKELDRLSWRLCPLPLSPKWAFRGRYFKPSVGRLAFNPQVGLGCNSGQGSGLKYPLGNRVRLIKATNNAAQP